MPFGRRIGFGNGLLDPFVYGPAVNFVVLLPRSVDVAILAAVVGSITGVFAAGASHFFLSRWNNSIGTIPVAVLTGGVLGALTGLLFRNFADDFLLPHLVVGTIAGAATFAITASVGRLLAARERADLEEAERV